MTITTPPSGLPTVASPPPPVAKTRRPGCLLSVAVALVGLAVLIGVATTDREIVAQSTSPRSGTVATIWVFSGLALLAIAVAAVRASSMTMRLIAVLLAVPLLAGAIFSTARANQIESSGLIETVLAIQAEAPAACGGAPVTGASTATTNDMRPLAIIDDEGQPLAWPEVVERGWAPSSVQDLRTVVCVDKEEQHVGWCNYTGDAESYRRTTYTRKIRVVRATDAGAIKEVDLKGSSAPACEPKIPEKQVHPDEEGGHVSTERVLDWVSQNLAISNS